MTKVVFVFSGDPYDVYIGRGRDPKTKAFHGTILQNKPGNLYYGNPWTHKKSDLAEFKTETAAEAIAKFREWLLDRPSVMARIRRELKGKTLACWCKTVGHPDTPCHGDVLAEIADSEDNDELLSVD